MGSGQSKGRSQMGGSGEDEEERSQWSRLPPELMQSIYRKVADVGDHIRLGAVSTAWRSAAVMQIQHQHRPWLLLPCSQHNASRSVLSLGTNRVRTLHLPEARGKVICGSSYGWFVLLHAKTASVFLLNPVTGSQIRLPPVTHFPSTAGIRGCRFRICGLEHFEIYNDAASGRYLGATLDGRELYIRSAFLSSSPGSPDCIVIATFPAGPKVAFCRPGSGEWTIVDTTLRFVAAVAYHGGKFYAIDDQGTSAICDGRPPFKATLVPSMKVLAGFHECTMVKPSGSGELLLVAISFGVDGSDARQNMDCDVYRLDQSAGGQAIRWSRASSIGDHAVFFSGAHCPCVPTRCCMASTLFSHMTSTLCFLVELL